MFLCRLYLIKKEANCEIACFQLCSLSKVWIAALTVTLLFEKLGNNT